MTHDVGTPRRRIAFAFDIDGVLMKGTKPLPGAQATLQKLQGQKIPFIFLTNGGGHTEEAHVAKLGQRLGLVLDPRQFVQSHTPYRDLVPAYGGGDKTVLVLGGHGHQIRELAHAYGFRRVLTSSDVLGSVGGEHVHPFPEMTREHHEKYGRGRETTLDPDLDLGQNPTTITTTTTTTTRIAAILVWSSPRDWCLDLQVIVDLLLSEGGVLGGPRSLKNGDATLPNCGFQQDGQPRLLFCNPDLEWATQHRHPRLAQGAFRAALEGVWGEVTKGRARLLYTACGKPTQNTFSCAERTLLGYAAAVAADADADADAVGDFERVVSAENNNAARGEEGREKGEGEGEGEGEGGLDMDRGNNTGIETVYMVGDNPESDIAGANAYRSQVGLEWKSVLVETGVYVSGTTPAHEPTHIVGNVKKAVEWAFSQND